MTSGSAGKICGISLIVIEYISGVNLVGHVSQIVAHSVGNYNIAHFFEGGKISFHS